MQRLQKIFIFIAGLAVFTYPLLLGVYILHYILSPVALGLSVPSFQTDLHFRRHFCIPSLRIEVAIAT